MLGLKAESCVSRGWGLAHSLRAETQYRARRLHRARRYQWEDLPCLLLTRSNIHFHVPWWFQWVKVVNDEKGCDDVHDAMTNSAKCAADELDEC
jgi:hypothetical protein